jgi:hypothetical protein
MLDERTKGQRKEKEGYEKARNKWKMKRKKNIKAQE